MYNDVYKCVTDERLVLDFVVPGFGADAITVKTAKVNGGDTFKVVVEGKYKGHTNKAGDPVPRVAFEKYVEDVKFTLSDDSDYGDELFKSKTFNSLDYDLNKLSWSATNGIVRVSIPKTELARGTEVTASDNADADSSGVATSDSVVD